MYTLYEEWRQRGPTEVSHPSAVGEMRVNAYRINSLSMSMEIDVGEFRPLVVTHFNIFISNLRYCFRRIETRKREWRVGFTCCTPIALLTASSVTLCPLLSTVDCIL